MKKFSSSILVIFSLLFSVALFAAEPTGEPVSMESFVQANLGVYKVLTVNGVKPKPDAEIAKVEIDTETKEFILTFPFCFPNGTCDPGFLIFTNLSTKVYKTKVSGTHETFVILEGVGAKQKRYTWDMDNGKLKFVNHQYIMQPANVSVVLEYDAIKAAE